MLLHIVYMCLLPFFTDKQDKFPMTDKSKCLWIVTKMFLDFPECGSK